ncbi:MAG: 30S ribosomal protein S16 [Candidatus Longimicrobiales bacterium M2_2A_002]
MRIRLRRVGRKKQPYWRVVVVPRGAPRDGAYIEELGFYNPRTRPAFLTLDLDKLDEWVQNGAEVSDSVRSLVRKARKGGDDDVVFTKPGEEAPRLKTAKKPERRPKSTATQTDQAEADEGGADEGGAEVTAAVEPAGEAEAAPEPTEAQEEAETESEAVEASATEAPETGAGAEAEAEAVEETEAAADEVTEAEAESDGDEESDEDEEK